MRTDGGSPRAFVWAVVQYISFHLFLLCVRFPLKLCFEFCLCLSVRVFLPSFLWDSLRVIVRRRLTGNLLRGLKVLLREEEELVVRAWSLDHQLAASSSSVCVLKTPEVLGRGDHATETRVQEVRIKRGSSKQFQVFRIPKCVVFC